jgi:hypothetical protein
MTGTGHARQADTLAPHTIVRPPQYTDDEKNCSTMVPQILSEFHMLNHLETAHVHLEWHANQSDTFVDKIIALDLTV